MLTAAVFGCRGLLGTVAAIAREEGPGALYKGLEPGMHRQVVYGGLRIGLYDPVSGLHTRHICAHLRTADQ